MTTEPYHNIGVLNDGTAVTSNSWTTVASLGPVDHDELPGDKHWLWFETKYENNNDDETKIRLRDTTNGSTTACISASNTSPSLVTATPASHTPSTKLVEYELQVNAASGNTSLVASVRSNVFVGTK